MSETQTYVVPESDDTFKTMAMMNGGVNNQWSNPFMYFIWLYMMRWLNNGDNANTETQRQLQTLQEQMQSNLNSDLIMAGINGNTDAIRQASDKLGVNFNVLQAAINEVNHAVKDTGCATQKAILDQGYQNQLNNERQTYQLTNSVNSLGNTVERGFCDTAYASQAQTCTLQNTIKDTGTINTNAIIAKLDQIENQALLDKIETLREKNSEQAVIINNGQQSAMFNQMINAAVTPINTSICNLAKEITSIEGKLPNTVTLPYSSATAVPTALAYQYGYSTNSWG